MAANTGPMVISMAFDVKIGQKVCAVLQIRWIAVDSQQGKNISLKRIILHSYDVGSYIG